MESVTRGAVPALVILLLSACTTQVVDGGSPGASTSQLSADVAPALTVEAFLTAANDDDWSTMGRLFGTKDGPFERIGGSRQEVELRMNAIALILKHTDFRVMAQNRVPGRDNPTIRVGVDITSDDGITVPDVGFFVVESNDGPWLVEEIELVKLTAA
jgi:hypothetical protein